MPTKNKKLTDTQQLELKRFVKKIENLTPNEQQEVIFERAKTGKGRYMVIAGPGSGKTTVAIKASTYFTGKAIYFSFNKKIQVDSNNKLTALHSPMRTNTLHGFGLGCLIKYIGGKCDINDDKYYTIIKEYTDMNWPLFLQTIRHILEQCEEEDKIPLMLSDSRSWSKALVHYCQVSLSKPTPDQLIEVIETFSLNDIHPNALIWPFVCDIVSYAIQRGKEQFESDSHTINYDDMIYYPNIYKDVPITTFDHIILDEAQDASKATQGLIMRACHSETQVFAIGDPRQGIYNFAGADDKSMPTLAHMLDAEMLPLTICYRCGTKIIDLANQLGGQIIPAPNAQEGITDVVPYEDYLPMLDIQEDENGYKRSLAIIGRTTNIIVKDCLKVLQTGKRAIVLGRNIGDSIKAIVTRLEELRASRGVSALAYDLSNLIELLDQYFKDQKTTIEESQRKNADLAISELSDKIETVKAFFAAYIEKCNEPSTRRENDPACSFSKNPKDFKQYIVGLFTDDENNEVIQFMTAHRSKGLEFNRVFVVGTDQFPHPKAKTDKQIAQEENLMYVTITRAIDELHFVKEPFKDIKLPGYENTEPNRPTIVVADGSVFLSDHFAQHNNEEIEQENEELQEAPFDLHLSFDHSDILDGEEDIQFHHDTIEIPTSDALEESIIPTEKLFTEDFDDQGEEDTQFIQAPLIEMPTQGRIGKALAIEVLCPSCGNNCVHPQNGSPMITQDLIGHSVTCSSCGKSCIVPLNAFSLTGDIVAREKLATGKSNTQMEKVGRTQKERKSTKGRKTKGDAPREPLQLSLDVRTHARLTAMSVDRSELFENLLDQYEPFTEIEETHPIYQQALQKLMSKKKPTGE